MSCEKCHGIGLVRIPEKNLSVACECQQGAEAAARLRRAAIPPTYQHATFFNFQKLKHTANALGLAWRFCEEFVPGRAQRSRGLLLTGSVGTGKTHLSVAALRELTEKKGIEGRFVDVRDLLDRLRSSYDENAGESQARILGRISKADLVVIDELGSARPSDWVFETIELLIGRLYNECIPVIVSTNLPNLQPGGSANGNEYSRAARPETLGDRIGARMWSRLQEMCTAVDMTGPDWRGR
jgi:DNA replication protein DnaC